MKLTYLTTTALLALLTTIGVRANDNNDPKNMKDTKQVCTATNPSCDAGFYVAAYGGVNFSTNYGNRRTVESFNGFNTDITPGTIHSDLGGVEGIKGGYRFDLIPVGMGLNLQPAVEVEGLYIGMQAKQAGNFPSIPPGLSIGTHSKTSFNNAAGFLNGIVRLKADQGFFNRFVPYVGVGVGVEYITAHTDGDNSFGIHPGNAKASDTDFAAQALFGVDFSLTQHWTLFTEYKFVDALGTDLKTPNIGNTSIDLYFKPDQLQQNLATVGVKYNF